MIHHNSMLKIGGQWRHLLVIESDEPMTFDSNEVNVTIDSNEGPITITYYTEGLYKEIRELGRYYYWFLYSASKVSVNGDNAEVADLKAEMNSYYNAMQEVIDE